MFFDVNKPRIQQPKGTSWKSKIWLPASKSRELAPGMKYYTMVARIALCFKLSTADSFRNRASHNLWISCLWRCWSMEIFPNKQLWDFINTGHWKVYYPTNYREGKFLLAVHLQIYSTPEAAPKRPGLLLFFRAKYLFLPVIYETKKSYFLVLEH